MADIPIQRKEGHSFWPWLIGILIVIAVIWFLFARRNTTPTTTMTDTTATMAAPAPGAAPATTAPGTAPATGAPATGTPAPAPNP